VSTDSQREAEGRSPRDAPRLRTPRHHRVVREGGPRRRLAITVAGIMLIVVAILGVITAAGILSGAGSIAPGPLPSAPVEVSGTVSDFNGSALANANVRVVGGNNSSLTNADGWYFLGQLSPGIYTIEASKSGFQSERRTVEIKPGFPRIVDFALAPGSGEVEGGSDVVPVFNDPTTGTVLFGVTILLCALAALVGGVCALRHRRYLVAVVGAAAGALTVGFFVGTLLSITALAILGSLKSGFLEASSHRLPWEGKAASKEDEKSTPSPPSKEGGR
jgi:hypothetical protein